MAKMVKLIEGIAEHGNGHYKPSGRTKGETTTGEEF